MGRRHPNHRLIKIHRTYTVEEAANALGLHKNTISRWTKQDDLTVIDKRRPKLIHGEALVQFLIERRKKTNSLVRSVRSIAWHVARRSAQTAIWRTTYAGRKVPAIFAASAPTATA